MMKCGRFEQNVADWVAGRMGADEADALAEHRRACPSCSALERAERSLRQGWQDLPPVASPPDLWLRVSDRLTAPPVRRWTLVPARRWALGGAVMAASALAFVYLAQPRPAVTVGGPQPGDEAKVISLVASRQTYSDGERDPFYSEITADRDAQRAVLIGDGSGR